MEARPLGDPGAVEDCSGELAALSRLAGDLAGRAMSAVGDPGFHGLAAVSYSIAGAALAIELRQRSRELADLARVVADAAEDLENDQRSWDRRAEAERKEADDEKAAPDRRSDLDRRYPV